MKQEKIKYFLVEDEYYRIPYNKFIKGVKLISEDAYIVTIKRFVYYWDDKVFRQDKQQVLLRKVRFDEETNIVFLAIKGEHIAG